MDITRTPPALPTYTVVLSHEETKTIVDELFKVDLQLPNRSRTRDLRVQLARVLSGLHPTLNTGI